MEAAINYNGQSLITEAAVEVYEYLDRADHRDEILPSFDPGSAGLGQLPGYIFCH